MDGAGLRCGSDRVKGCLYPETNFSRYYTGRPGALLPLRRGVIPAKALIVKEL